MKCLKRGKKSVRWSKQDILEAVELRAVSKKAYVFLRNKKHFPLPGVSTLKGWVSGYRCRPGISDFAMEILKAKKDNFTAWDRVCVLSYDEMSVNQRLCYDMKEDQIFGPHSKVFVFMIRGLLTNWKQPIYFAFDVTLTTTLLTDVIGAVERVGYTVVASCCRYGRRKQRAADKTRGN